MNVARKSTAKLPQKWQQMQKLPSKEDEGDSGVASTDSTDSFQDALMNLKALSGGSDTVGSDRSELKELPTAGSTEKAEHANKAKAASPSKTNGEEKDILDQIDDIVNDKKTCDKGGEPACKNDSKDSDQGSEGEDDVLIINEDEQNEENKDVKSDTVSQATADSKHKATPGSGPKNPLRIGEKVRYTVHNIMSKLAQNNPDVNSLLSKTKSDVSVDSGGSGRSSPMIVRQDKGNLFDNFDLPDRGGKSPAVSDKDAKSPLPACASASSGDAVGKPEEDTCLKNGIDSDVGEEKDAAEETETSRLPVTEELSQSSDRGIATPSEDSQPDKEACDVQPVSSADSMNENSDSKDAVNEVEEKSPSPSQEKETNLENSEGKVADPELTGSALTEDSAMRESSPVLPETPKLTEGDTSDTKAMETTESEPSDQAIPEAATAAGDASPAVSDKSSSEGRKRQHGNKTADSDEDSKDDDLSQPPKRSRLDEVIGKLGERVPLLSDGVENDSFDYEDSPAGDGESVEKQSEEISASASEEEEDKVSSPESKTIQLSKQELEVLVVTTAKAAIERYQSSEILALNRRIEELVQSEEEWRQKAKNLERQVLDLTVLQQKLEKRKAHTAALKSITTRSIGVWVTEDKLKTNTPQKQSGNKTPPATPPATAVSTLVWGPVGQASGRLMTSASAPMLSTATGGMPITSTIPSRNTSVAHLLSQTARMPTAASCAAATRVTPPRLNTAMPRAPVASLTNNAAPMVRGPSPASMPSTSLVLVNSAAGAVGGKVASSQLIGTPMVATSAAPSTQVKIIDLTMEDDAGGSKQLAKHVVTPAPVRGMVPQQVVRQLTPMSQGVPSSAILLSSAAGTQVVNTANLQRPGMLQPFQVVTIANAGNLRPGSLVTVVPSQAGTMVRHPSSATTLTTTARESAPRLVSQQQTTSVTFVRPPANSGVRASSLPPGGAVGTAAGAHTSVALSTASQKASATSGPGQAETVATSAASNRANIHPAPLPPNICPRGLPADIKGPPPRPGLKISRVKQGIVLSWNMVVPSDCVEIASYQLFAYQETNNTVPLTSLWKKVGDVKALPLPMACTLTQFQDGNKYHFAVRAIDVHGRSGQFSEPSYIFLTKAA